MEWRYLLGGLVVREVDVVRTDGEWLCHASNYLSDAAILASYVARSKGRCAHGGELLLQTLTYHHSFLASGMDG